MDSQTVFFLFAVFYFFSFLFLFLFIYVIFKILFYVHSNYVLNSSFKEEIGSINTYVHQNNARWVENTEKINLLTERVKTLEGLLVSNYNVSCSSSSENDGYVAT